MVTHRIDQTAVIAALRGAAPYIRLAARARSS